MNRSETAKKGWATRRARAAAKKAGGTRRQGASTRKGARKGPAIARKPTGKPR